MHIPTHRFVPTDHSLSSHPAPAHYLQFAWYLNVVKNGSYFLIAFDNNFVKALLAAGEEQSHQQL